MKPQKLFYIILVLWMTADLLQAVFTPIHADEAYYAIFGRHLDWGYYDHPPMVALMTALGSAFFSGNLSIRFATVILHGGTLCLLWRTIPISVRTTRDVWTFFVIAASLVMFSIYGFITTPDAPLLFFTALFFYLYKHYLGSPSWATAIAIGATVAAMLYSKYMAVLVVSFVVLSNLKLLKDRRLWMAMLFAAVLFLPHVLWQVHNEFPSFQYHLLDRNSGFHLKNILEYLPNQFAVFNPVCLCISAWFCWKKRNTNDYFERACVFTIAGFVLFFWVMTIKGHSEPHWTVAASVPMILLLWQNMREEKWSKWLTLGIIPMTTILLILRVVAPLVLDKPLFKSFANRHRYEIIHEYCGSTPVMFVGSFQDPSLYDFYTGEKTMQLSSLYSRKTQFDIWQFDKELQGKPVCIVNGNTSGGGKANTHKMLAGYDWVEKDGVSFKLHKTEAYQGVNRVAIEINSYHIFNDTISVELTLHNLYDIPLTFNNIEFPITLHAVYLQDKQHYIPITCPIDADIVIPGNGCVSINTTVRYIPNAPIVFCLDNVVCRSVNSKPITPMP